MVAGPEGRNYNSCLLFKFTTPGFLDCMAVKQRFLITFPAVNLLSYMDIVNVQSPNSEQIACVVAHICILCPFGSHRLWRNSVNQLVTVLQSCL